MELHNRLNSQCRQAAARPSAASRQQLAVSSWPPAVSSNRQQQPSAPGRQQQQPAVSSSRAAYSRQVTSQSPISTCYQLLPGAAAGRPLQYHRSQVRLHGAAGQHLLPAITRCRRRPTAAVLPVTGAAARRGRPVCRRRRRRRRPPRADTAGWEVIISVYGPTADAPGLLWR